MKMIITQQVHEFRETARHLWNTNLRIHATWGFDSGWDSVDNFREICALLYKEIINSRLGIESPNIPLDLNSSHIPEYRIFVENKGNIPLMINRDIPASGYWDHPVTWIPAEGIYDIRPISFFDFDSRDWIKMEYYRARILKCSAEPSIEGRDALIQCDYVEIKFITEADKDRPRLHLA